MNLRTVVAVLYVLVFAFTFVNMATLPINAISDNAATIFSAIILAVMGALIAAWVYEDGENIKMLHDEIEKLVAKVQRLEKVSREEKSISTP